MGSLEMIFSLNAASVGLNIVFPLCQLFLFFFMGREEMQPRFQNDSRVFYKLHGGL